jgi:hypothetical protein
LHDLIDRRGPSCVGIALCHPKEGSSIALIAYTQISHDGGSLAATGVAVRRTAVIDTKPEDNLGGVTRKQIIDQVCIMRKRSISSNSCSIDAIQSRSDVSIVVLWHQKVNGPTGGL